MKTFGGKILGLIIILIVCAFSSAYCAKTLEKSFPIGPGGALTLINKAGSITLEGSSRSDVHLKIESTKDIEENFELTFERLGDSLFIRTERKSNLKPILFGLIKVRDESRSSLNFTISVPENFNPNINTGGGAIEIRSVSGRVNGRTSGGSVKCEQVSGTLNAKTSGGSITCERISGPMTVKTSGGSIDLQGIEGAFDASTSGGPIKASELTGDGSLHTSGGSINVEVAAGNYNLKTSGGSITVQKLSGNISARTSGGGISVEFLQPPSEDCTLSTSAGNIDLSLPRQSGAMISARTSAGKVNTDLPITVTGEVGRGKLEGRLGSGGPLLDLSTSAGSINIKQLPNE
ncbi:MAG TPA: DUF4097 family beta strand repeat-containing protein [archaeon]|nr:DUF4097 family beta strand repeat-containing protein [archaeon]